MSCTNKHAHKFRDFKSYEVQVYEYICTSVCAVDCVEEVLRDSTDAWSTQFGRRQNGCKSGPGNRPHAPCALPMTFNRK